MRVFTAILLLFFCNIDNKAQCTSVGPNNGSISNNSVISGTVSWANMENVYLSDNNMATATAITLGGDTKALMVSGFDFSIPSSATINGIIVQIQKKASGLFQNVHDASVKIIQNGSIVGNEHALSGTWPGGASYFTYGSTSDTWGASWTPADINSTNFGVSLTASLAGLSLLPTAYIDQIIITVCYTDAPLPIELLSFDGTRINYNQVELNWTTITETNNSFFSIDYSSDGNNWKEKGKIKGAGFSNMKKEYDFIDSNNSEQVSYYRLKQTDFNGKSTYFKIIAINPLKSSESVIIYPNPAKESINIHSANNMVSVNVINLNGTIINSIQYSIKENKKDVQLFISEEIGMYIINVIDSYGKIYSDKIILR